MEEFIIDNGQHLLIRAKLIYLGCGSPLFNGALEINSGRIERIGPFHELKSQSAGAQLIDLEDLIVLPTLTNTHLHLELSPLKLRIPTASKFIYWVRSVIKKKAQLSPLEIHESAKWTLRELWFEGIGLIGEVTNSALTLDLLANSPFCGYIFQEVISFRGSHPLRHLQDISSRFKVTYSAHAPYSVSPLLLQAIKAYNNKRKNLFAIHCAESLEEVEFLKTGKGPLKDLLIERGQWQEDFKPPMVSPLRYLHDLGLLDEKTLLVHVIHLEEEDFELVTRTKVNLCLCPRSNLYTGVGLPNLPKLLQTGVTIALGTDSLASNDRLSIFEEMKTFKLFYPDVSPLTLLEMATANGAKILGFKDKGIIKEGLRPDFLAVETKESKSDNLENTLEEFILGEKKVKIRFYAEN
ncbi:MAG: amidohydrolase family protein [Caldimicrobium sp.]|nr:amidohydrolase family protein [Caldimicrobium sp.]MCX7613432.1 amidohydrolase family protein [Caldimicrobium sp.]MDW8183027.1 amidohydrolase family protein [Caldimicrobium sp.]